MQRRRLFFQLGFFALFLLAPALDLLRFDLNQAQLWFLGQRWSLGIDAFKAGEISANEAAMRIFLRAFLPAIVAVVAFLGVAWRYGRLYCGWLCPHFTLVETLNTALHRACGKLSVWDRHRTTRAGVKPSARWWPVFGGLCLAFGFMWAITLLTYLLPPATIWGNLFAGTLTPNQARFLVISTAVFTAEFAFARHLFCRFGCAVGLFQSLAWMANPKGMVVAFDRDNARDCRTCTTTTHPQGSACDNGCPMRLHPRNIKRMMFSCVQCGQCLDSCDETQTAQAREPLLQWKVGADAVRETLRQRKAELELEHPLRRFASSPPERGGPHQQPGETGSAVGPGSRGRIPC
ncbi:MAG: 4Fe-4S binding protein [Hydrogenophaga sp.]|uniref:4Fe-4S binding protein n=1 Tax=Hydrogenophaga sp. TaxID=1904254 RepID=UPI0025C1FED3|nr:4Fe-4S binding protein [Hydrogenophaga sp.]MBT9550190.1 4Fe-4S binding protein [Hydrogenophaga sp.]